MKTLPEQDTAVAALLNANGISYSAYYGGTYNKDNWNADLWRVSFTKGGKTFSTDFKTGLGHRMAATGFTSLGANLQQYRDAVKAVTGLERVLAETNATDKNSRKLYVIAPTQASVLYCLLADASMAEDGFSDFCANCGYDTDSRKALEMFLEIDKQAQAMKQVFSNDTIEQLNVLLEDY